MKLLHKKKLSNLKVCWAKLEDFSVSSWVSDAQKQDIEY